MPQHPVAEWFNSLPKALKLMYMRLNTGLTPDIIAYYAQWDNTQLTYFDQYSSTQVWITNAYKRLMASR